jgi:acetyltransferase EpsM
VEPDIILFGASGHGKVIIDALRSCGLMPVMALDNFPKHDTLLGVPVVLPDGVDAGRYRAIVSVGNNKLRKRIAGEIPSAFATAIHAKAVVAPSAVIGQGTVVLAGALVNPDAQIGKHCIINTGAVIEHDADIADFVHISPGAKLAGNVAVGEGTQVGIGATVIQGVTIGRWATIGAGAVIIRDIPDYAVVVGNPGRIIKYNEP